MANRSAMAAGVVLVSCCGLAMGLGRSGQPPAAPKPDAGAPSAPAKDKAESTAKIEVRDGYRYITSNGMPDHETGAFPNSHNPNSIKAQRYTFRVPEKGVVAAKPRNVGMQNFGVAVNGVPFDPATAEWWQRDPSKGWHEEAIGGPHNLGVDSSNAHVQPNGAYHYHAIPTALMKKLAAQPGADGKIDERGEKRMILVGWAADGFPIYCPYSYTRADDATSEIKKLRSGWVLKSGERAAPPNGPGGKIDGAYEQDWEFKASSGDLDECNGRTGVTPEYPTPPGTYYYVISDNYPFVPRMYRGTPDASFNRGPGGPGGGPPGGRGGPGGGRPGGGDRPPPPRG